MKLLEKIAQRHEFWIQTVKTFGVKDYAEDIVQEMYLKAWKYIEAGTLREDTVNTYVYTILRSLSVDLQREVKRKPMISIDEDSSVNLIQEPEDPTKEDAFTKITDRLQEEIDSWHWFDKMLFKDIYIDQDKSMREIHKNTNISLATIFNTIKRCKQKCYENVQEDIEDYKNQEYERI
jgi:RNA polymerase sigma factor (sigma-70 family)